MFRGCTSCSKYVHFCLKGPFNFSVPLIPLFSVDALLTGCHEPTLAPGVPEPIRPPGVSLHVTRRLSASSFTSPGVGVVVSAVACNLSKSYPNHRRRISAARLAPRALPPCTALTAAHAAPALGRAPITASGYCELQHFELQYPRLWRRRCSAPAARRPPWPHLPPRSLRGRHRRLLMRG